MRKLHNIYLKLSQDRRSFLIYKSLFLSLGARVVSIGINFLLVPVTLGYLDRERYGIWLVLVSIVSWIYLLDIGLGNGLRNKLTESLASGDTESGKKYVSTTYLILFIIAIVFILLFSPLCFFINWVSLLNVSVMTNNELGYTVLILLCFFSFHFFLKNIGTIYTSIHKPHVSLYLSACIGLLNFIFILVIKRFCTPSLIPIAFAMGISQLLVYLFAMIYSFKKELKYIRPEIHSIDTTLVKSLFSMGVKFFVLQMSSVIMMTSSTIIISRVDNPSSVIEYDLSNKYLCVSNYIFSFIIIPYWSAFTEAFARKEYEWIDKKVKNLNKLWFYSMLVTIVMVFLSQPFYKLWLGDKVHISFYVTLLTGLYYMAMNFNSIYYTLLNGISEIKLSFNIAIVQLSLFFPLIFLFQLFLERVTYSILVVLILFMIVSCFLLRFKYSKIKKNYESIAVKPVFVDK
jgi:O-antigen/teichoic acid export membrane protein